MEIKMKGEDEDFNEFLDDLDKWYKHKTDYLKLCKEIDDHFGGHDKVPGDLGEYEIIYEHMIESLNIVEYNLLYSSFLYSFLNLYHYIQKSKKEITKLNKI